MISKEQALSVFNPSTGKVDRKWKTKLAEFDINGLTTQDIWDMCQDDLKCPVCKVEDRKVKQTNIGRTNTCGSPSCANLQKREKTEATSMLRYGTLRPSQHNDIKLKQQATNLARHGGHPSKLLDVQEKRKKTNLEKYGCVSPAMGPDLKDKSVRTYKESRKSNYINLIWPARKESIYETLKIKALSEWTAADDKIKWVHDSCGHEWAAAIPDGSTPWCPACGLSKEQFGVEEFIRSNYEYEILRNDRRTIKPVELDIFMPHLKVAVEMNGWYWHKDGESTSMKFKTEKCEELGIRLVHIMDWEWNERREIVTSHLLHLLGKTGRKINGRSTKVIKIDAINAEIFFTQNHISGHVKASHYYGVFYKDELVAAMSLGKPRWNKDTDLEIFRWATKSKTVVHGAFSKVLKIVIADLSPSKILSYCDLRWGTGAVYAKSGFRLIENTKPNYWWIKSKHRLSRYSTQKHMLKNIVKNFDPSLSETENMLIDGWSKVSDAGNGKWILTI